MKLRCLRMILVLLLSVSALMLAACGKSLSGTYANAANHTIDFNANGTCTVQDNGVTWPGTYDYDSGSGAFKLTVSGFGGSVEIYDLRQDGDNLILNRYGYDFVFKPYDVWLAEGNNEPGGYVDDIDPGDVVAFDDAI